MLTRRAIAVSSALLAVGCACSSAHPYAAQPTTPTAVVVRPSRTQPPTSQSSAGTSTTTASGSSSTTSAGETTTVAPVTQPTAPPAGLASLILGTAPSGYERQPDDVGQTGPTNIAEAALDDVSPNGRRALLVTGFVGGYQRQWTSGDGFTIDQDFLYQFETPKGAQGYAQHWRDTLQATNQQGTVLQAFTPALIPGAFGLATQDKTGSTAVVMFAKGVYAVEATVNGGAAAGSAPVDQTGPATALGYAQYQALP